MVKDNKGNLHQRPMHENRAIRQIFFVTASSARAVPAQHGPVLHNLQKMPSTGNWTRGMLTEHAPMSRLLFLFTNFC